MIREYQDEDDLPDAVCEICGDDLQSQEISDAAFNLTGQVVCDGCAEGIIEDNDQFGVGA